MSTRYKEYQQLNLPSIGEEILAKWKATQAFEKSISLRDGNQPFVFYEGPPSANGLPGIHHVISRTLKDLVCRYKTMQGFQVQRKGGWDTHGLPIELGVEKELGITKEDIGKKISVEEYNKKCREAVLRYKDKWDEITEKSGYWVDLKNPYITFENNYIESLWWCLSELYKKGYLYESVSIQPYSPAAGTGLSSHELNQPGTYKDVKDTSCVAMFKVVNKLNSKFLFDAAKSENVYFTAWTTTPWTLPSNLGLTVGPNIDYVLIQATHNETRIKNYIIIAEKLVSSIFVRNDLESLFVCDFLESNLTDNKHKFDGFHSQTGYPIEVKDGNVDEKVVRQFLEQLRSSGFEKGIFCTKAKLEQALKDKFPEIIFYDFSDYYEKCKILEFKGSDIEGCEYEQLFQFDANKTENLNAVTTEDGTGIVHTAPAFGADDFKVGKKYDIGILTMVDREGKFVDGLGKFSNLYVKNYKDDPNYVDVNVEIAVTLKKENRAFKVEKYEHNYPHCWRTDKPIIYYPLDAWFIKTTAVKDRMVELNKTINWKPAATGTGRFGNWLENMVDWNLSRSRFWGTPLPIWKTEDGEEEKCIGSIEELNTEIRKAAEFLGGETNKHYLHEGILDLHKPYVDDIVLISASGKPMKRVPDLIDVWFDSGAMPYAQWHFPFENVEAFAQNYPADFICEGVDQTRGWFYTLHALAALLKESINEELAKHPSLQSSAYPSPSGRIGGAVASGLAYRTVVSNGLVLDKNGNKMSKRLGNVVDPFETINKYGADATRWYLITNASPWDSLKFDLGGIQEVQRKFFGTLYNTYQFFALYANVDGFAFKENYIPVKERPEIDQWILSSLNTLIKTVQQSMDDYEPTQAGRAIEDFVDAHLSNWYVRLCRRRFWKGEYEQDKICAYQTLYECLETISLLIAPIAPFFADWLFLNLNEVSHYYKNESVHHVLFPKANAAIINVDLENRMQLAQDASSLILSLRKKVNIKVRQPLQKVIIPALDEAMIKNIKEAEEIIKAETNIKQIEILEANNNFIRKKTKANFKTLGKKRGAKMKWAAEKIAEFGNDDIHKLDVGDITLVDDTGEKILITKEDVEISTDEIPGFEVAVKGSLTVALDVTISDELKKEGDAREFVNRIQTIRKESGFNLTDKIIVKVSANEALLASFNKYKTYICAEILADSLEFLPQLNDGNAIEINETIVNVNVIKKVV
jgi:isoleucyl-tRNA synthetase